MDSCEEEMLEDVPDGSPPMFDVSEDSPAAFDVQELIEEIQKGDLAQDTVLALWRCLRPAKDGILDAAGGRTKLVNGESVCDTTTADGSSTSTMSVEVQAMPDVSSKEIQVNLGTLPPKYAICRECKKKVVASQAAKPAVKPTTKNAGLSGGPDGASVAEMKKETVPTPSTKNAVLSGGADGASMSEKKDETVPAKTVDDVVDSCVQDVEKPPVVATSVKDNITVVPEPTPSSSATSLQPSVPLKGPLAAVRGRKDTATDDSDIEVVFDALPSSSLPAKPAVAEPAVAAVVVPETKITKPPVTPEPIASTSNHKEIEAVPKIKENDEVAEKKETEKPKAKKDDEKEQKKKKHKKHKDKGKEKKKEKEKKKSGEKKKKAEEKKSGKPEEKAEEEKKVVKPVVNVAEVKTESKKPDEQPQKESAIDDFPSMKVVQDAVLKIKLERTPSGNIVPPKPKLTDEELCKKHRCRPSYVKVKKLDPGKIERLQKALRRFGRQKKREMEERAARKAEKREKFKALLEKKEKKKREREMEKAKKIRRIETSSDEEEDKKKVEKVEVQRRRVNSSCDSSDDGSVKQVKPKLVTSKPVKRQEARSSEDSSEDEAVVLKQKKKPPSRPASSSSTTPPRIVPEHRRSSSDSSDDEDARKKRKIMSAVNEQLKKRSAAPPVPTKVVEKRKEPPSAPPEPVAKKPKVEEEKKTMPEKVQDEVRTPSPSSAEPPAPPSAAPLPLGGALSERPPNLSSGLNDVFAKIEAEEREKPEFRLKAWESKDEKENEDINHPEWLQLKQIKTEKERYAFVRKDWKTDQIPNANICRTFLSKRSRENGEQVIPRIMFQARPGSVSAEEARVSLGNLQNSRFNHTYVPVEDLRRLPKVMPSYHFDYFWIRMNQRLQMDLEPKRKAIEKKKRKVDAQYKPLYEAEVLPKERGKMRKIWDAAKKPLDEELREFSSKLSKPLVEIYARFFKAREEGLEWEAFYTELPEATFTSLELTLNQFLNLERFHLVAFDYRKLYGSVEDASEGVERVHTLKSCAYCAKTGQAIGRV